MFRFGGSQDQEGQSHPQNALAQSWYPPSVVSSSDSSFLSIPTGSSCSNSFNLQRPTPANVSSAEAAGILYLLKEKSFDELRKLLSDKDAYQRFLLSLDEVKIQTNIRDELRKEAVQLARENLDKEPRIMELRNQCRIIRTSELAAAEEKLNELDRQKETILQYYSPAALLQRLQERMTHIEEESEDLHRKLLYKEIDLSTFVQKYKKLRTTQHRRALIQLAARTYSIR